MSFVRTIAITLLLVCAVVPRVARAIPRVAVQPFEGASSESMRFQVARIIGKHGFRVLTTLRAVTGTAQYPGLAKDKRLSAIVVADVAETGKRIRLGFLIWQGIDGSVVGRWEVAGPKGKVQQKIAKEFWKRLGPAIQKALPPPSDVLPPAPPMRINAGAPGDEAIRPGASFADDFHVRQRLSP